MYMGSDACSSADTRARARDVALDTGAYHLTVGIDSMVSAVVKAFAALCGRAPAFKVHGTQCECSLVML
jgi:NAD+ synthase (glutamine-hydrolysing)